MTHSVEQVELGQGLCQLRWGTPLVPKTVQAPTLLRWSSLREIKKTECSKETPLKLAMRRLNLGNRHSGPTWKVKTASSQSRTQIWSLSTWIGSTSKINTRRRLKRQHYGGDKNWYLPKVTSWRKSTCTTVQLHRSNRNSELSRRTSGLRHRYRLWRKN